MEDVDYLHRLWRDPAIRRYFWDDEVIPREKAETAVRESLGNFGRDGFGLWVAERREGGDAPISFCGLRHLDGGPEVEVLYDVSPPEWGKGLATELALAMLRHGFERAGLTRIRGVADTENVASHRVLEKVGMTFSRVTSLAGAAKRPATRSDRKIPEGFRREGRGRPASAPNPAHPDRDVYQPREAAG